MWSIFYPIIGVSLAVVFLILFKAARQKGMVERDAETVYPPAAPKRVAIIGAGPSGLVTASELLANGHEATVFEASDRIGGVFAHYYECGRLTSSTCTTNFSRMDDGLMSPQIWTFHEYVAYLNRYAEEMGVIEHVELETRVLSVHRRGEGDVEVTITHNDEVEVRQFNHVVIATGIAETPKMPMLKNAEEFEGEIIHSQKFRDGSDYAGKRVCVIGLGESGSDICLEIAKHAEKLCMSTRRGPGFIIPRFAMDMPSDVDSSRVLNTCPRDVRRHWFAKLRFLIMDSMSPNDDMKALMKANEINEMTSGDLSGNERFATKNTSFIEALLYHDAIYRPGIEKLTRNGIVFVDGTTFECDTIVCATGFKVEYPFLSEHHPELQAKASPNVRNLYKHCYSSEYGVDICWIGYNRPGIGAIPPLSEMAARYFVQLIGGFRKLPPPHEMERLLEKDRERDLRYFPMDGENIPELIDYITTMEDFGNLCGTAPLMYYLLVYDPWLWYRMWFGPVNPTHFRWIGHDKFDAVKLRERFRRLPMNPLRLAAFDLMVRLYGYVTREYCSTLFS